MMNRRIAGAVLFCSTLLLPISGVAQQRDLNRYNAHQRAEREQTAKDHQHHTGAKIVGGSAVGGAVVGGLMGGGKGALIGGAVGAGGGAVANKVRKDRAVRKRERSENYRR
jgi:outer membrane lipoprotein SlyB